jgi:hypothetical protein
MITVTDNLVRVNTWDPFTTKLEELVGEDIELIDHSRYHDRVCRTPV